MKQFIFLIILFAFLSLSFSSKNEPAFVKENFNYAARQVKLMLKDAGVNKSAFPRT